MLAGCFIFSNFMCMDFAHAHKFWLHVCLCTARMRCITCVQCSACGGQKRATDYLNWVKEGCELYHVGAEGPLEEQPVLLSDEPTWAWSLIL